MSRILIDNEEESDALIADLEKMLDNVNNGRVIFDNIKEIEEQGISSPRGINSTYRKSYTDLKDHDEN